MNAHSMTAPGFASRPDPQTLQQEVTRLRDHCAWLEKKAEEAARYTNALKNYVAALEKGGVK